MAQKPIGYWNGKPYYNAADLARLQAERIAELDAAAAADAAPVAAPAQPPPSGAGGGGGTGLPSYEDLYKMALNSPFWRQLEDQRRAADAAELAGTQEAARRAYVQFGEGFDMPTGWSKYNLLDAQSKALADQNTKSGLSTIARLRESRDDQITALVRRLNARGLRRSGSKLFGMNRAQLGYDRASTDARNSLLAQIAQGLGAYGNNSYQRMMGNYGQLQNIMSMYSANYTPTYSGGGGQGSNAGASTWSNPYAGASQGQSPLTVTSASQTPGGFDYRKLVGG